MAERSASPPTGMVAGEAALEAGCLRGRHECGLGGRLLTGQAAYEVGRQKPKEGDREADGTVAETPVGAGRGDGSETVPLHNRPLQDRPPA